MKRRILFLGLIFILALAAGIFSYPQGYGKQLLPWKLGLDIVGGTNLTYDIDLSNVPSTDKDSVVSGIKRVIEDRVNLFGVAEPQVATMKSGDNYRLSVELAGIKDVKEAINQIGLTPLLDFREVLQVGEGDQAQMLFIGTDFTGKYIKGATVAFDQTTRAPYISLEFNEEGSKAFEELTGRNVGKQLAVFLDGQVVEIATVNEKISGGSAMLTGKFTIKDAKELVSRFNAGALPAPIKLVKQSTIGATLGQEFLKKAIIAGAIGTAVVIFFMIVFYGGMGLIASLALIIYISLAMAGFKLIGVTMSLAAIAGFILSIGMAVDANILIFERTREELKKGLSKASALSEGFRRAWSSIFDSNISTIISASILYILSSSFIRGFALTLILGVVVSMFTAVTVTRMLLKVLYRK